MPRPKILIIADVPGWIFDRHAQEIRARLKPRFRIDVGYFSKLNELNLNSYDVIYLMDALTEEVEKFAPHKRRMVIGVRGEFYYPKDSIGLFSFYKKRIVDRASYFHVVNKRQFYLFQQVSQIPLFLVPHGVDTKFFDKRSSSGNLIFTLGMVGFPGSGGRKGFDLAETACLDSGISFFQVFSRNSKKEMKGFYNRIDAYCCMSESEGQNNPIMEAGAMGIPVISTKTGAAPEMIEDGVTGYLINRTVEDLVSRLVELKSHRSQSPAMGKCLQEVIRKYWSWDVRIKGFEDMFEVVLSGRRM